jgi:hypothetical protein
MIEDPRRLGIANLIREIFSSVDMFFGMVQLEKADVFSDRTCFKISSDIFYHNPTVSGCNFCTSVIVTLLAAPHRHLPEQNAESAHAIGIFT